MNNPTKPQANSHIKISSIARAIGFIVVLALVVALVYRVLAWKDTSGDYFSSTDQLYSTDKDLIDAVFVGSSHVYQGIYPSVLWNEYGYSAFDMSVSGEDKNSSYHTIVELLKTQSPQVVCVDIYGLLYEGYAIEGNLYRNSLAMKPSVNSYELITDIVEPSKVQDHLFRFPIIHTRYQELGKYDFYSNPVNASARGEVYKYECFPMSNEQFIAPGIAEIGDLSPKNIEWLDSLYELSINNNFKLVLFIVPFEISTEQQMVINAAVAYAESKGITCFDFNRYPDSLGINPATDFQDHSHLNYLGAHKLSSWFGKWFAENLQLADHRGDIRYYQWDADGHLYKNYMDQFAIRASDNLSEMLTAATSNPDFITVLSLDFAGAQQIDGYSEALNSIGISNAEIYQGGMWISKNGAFLKVLENDPAMEPYIEYFTSYDALRLHYDAHLAPTNITVGHNSYNNYGYYVTLLVYDTYTKQVIYSGGK